MAFGRNGMGPCGKRAKWSLGEMGKLGEMIFGRNEKNGRKLNWAKQQKGRTDIGQSGKRVKLERARKKNRRNGKSSGKMEMGEIGLGELGINRL